MHNIKALGNLSSGAFDAMHMYSWPGNNRELQNVVERSVILRKGDMNEADDLHLHTLKTQSKTNYEIPSEGIDLVKIEKEYIRAALKMSGGNMSEAARLLNISGHVLILQA